MSSLHAHHWVARAGVKRCLAGVGARRAAARHQSWRSLPTASSPAARFPRGAWSTLPSPLHSATERHMSTASTTGARATITAVGSMPGSAGSKKAAPSAAAAPSTSSTTQAVAKGSGDVAGSAAGEQLTYKQRLRTFMKAYGMPGVGIYAFISCSDLALLYAAAKAGLDIRAIVDAVGLSWLTQSGNAASATETLGPFVVAYGAHKLLMPARFALSFAVTPPIVRYLRAKGWVKERPVETEAATGVVVEDVAMQARGGEAVGSQEEGVGQAQDVGGATNKPPSDRFTTKAAADAAALRKRLRDISY